MSAEFADGYAVINFFIPLPFGLRLADGATFRFELWPGGPLTDVTHAVQYIPLPAALPEPEDSMHRVALLVRFLRVDGPSRDIEHLDDVYGLAAKVLPQHASHDSSAFAAELGDVAHTVVHVKGSSPCLVGSRKSLVQALQDMCGWSLDAIRQIQKGYRAAADMPGRLTTVENAPPMVWMQYSRYTSDGTFVDSSAISLFPTGSNGSEELEVSDLDEATHHGIVEFMDVQDNQFLFRRYNEFALDSRDAFFVSGDYRTAVLSAATAAECLLDDLLCFALWWERKTPDEARSVLAKETYKKVKSEFEQRFGGNWVSSKIGPVFEWHEKLARLRDRIIHGGYVPSRSQAESAIQAMRGLRGFVADRVVSAKCMSSYRYLALLFLGPNGLAARGVDPAALEDWYKDGNWNGRILEKWRAVTTRKRIEHYAGSAAPNFETAVIFTVITPANIQHFALDMLVALAVEVPLARLDAAERGRLEEIRSSLAEGERSILPFVQLGERETFPEPSMWSPAEDVLPGYVYMRT